MFFSEKSSEIGKYSHRQAEFFIAQQVMSLFCYRFRAELIGSKCLKVSVFSPFTKLLGLCVVACRYMDDMLSF